MRIRLLSPLFSAKAEPARFRPFHALGALLLTALLQAATLPRGEVIPKVVCEADRAFSYALYLPTGYREDRPAPVLFGFSPGGTGVEPVELFQEAAERSGYIVAGSNDSRNGQVALSARAREAMWKDVHARFKVDPARS